VHHTLSEKPHSFAKLGPEVPKIGAWGQNTMDSEKPNCEQYHQYDKTIEKRVELTLAASLFSGVVRRLAPLSASEPTNDSSDP
jgi:hypothetical protein